MKSIFKYTFKSSLLSAIISFFLLACNNRNKEEVPNPTTGLTKIADGFAKGAATKIEIWAKEYLFTGYNQLYFALYDSISGKRITESHIHLNPIMRMKEMSHSCPKEEPDTKAVNELFPASIMFTMSSGEMEQWTLETKVHNHTNNKSGKIVFDIKVAATTPTRMAFIKTDAGATCFLSYYFPEKIKVGVNIFEVIIFTKNEKDFVPAKNLIINFSPEMPAMEHSSANNENPSPVKEGHYRGKVNFTMTGDWRLNLEIFDEKNTLLDKAYFDVTVN